ncbi:MAG: hypothetical protein ABIQ16_17275 [Polyangiaceae bacterium]
MKPWRNSSFSFAAWALIGLAAFAVHRLQEPLAARFVMAKVKNDVYALPPPQQVVVMSLGYRSALADLIFAHVLVASGIHVQERRGFEFVGKYLEAVNELDPKFAAPYRMADALLTLQAKPVGPEGYRQARRILERGMKELPFDQALWASSGQFFAYLSPEIFPDSKEQDDWKLAGGRALARACELVGSNENIPYQCVIAAGLLTRVGAEAASRQFLERMLVINDDPEIRKLAGALLQKAVGADARDRFQARQQAFQKAWGADLPFVTRGAMLTVGPRWNPASCAGASKECVTSWRSWAAHRDSPLGGTSTPDRAASTQE